jgi:hypothetical protein
MSLEIVETDRVDELIHRSRDEVVSIEKEEKAQLRHLLRKYGRTRGSTTDKRHNKALQADGASRRR